MSVAYFFFTFYFALHQEAEDNIQGSLFKVLQENISQKIVYNNNKNNNKFGVKHSRGHLALFVDFKC